MSKKIGFFLTAVLLLARTLLFADEESLKPEYQALVRAFVTAVKGDDRKAIAKLVKYPLRQKYPIPPIRDEKEFLQRFDQIFDKDLRKEITHSSIANDWSAVGWRGIMLEQGVLWLDYDGTLIAVNYQSNDEQKLKKELIQKDKEGLYPSLREFEEPELIGETDKFLIRVDETKESVYRYVAWPKGSPQSSKPDLVLNNGEAIFEGSGGNHHFDFKNGDYLYSVDVTVIGADDSPPGSLEVYKSGKLLLTQDFKSLRP